MTLSTWELETIKNEVAEVREFYRQRLDADLPPLREELERLSRAVGDITEKQRAGERQAMLARYAGGGNDVEDGPDGSGVVEGVEDEVGGVQGRVGQQQPADCPQDHVNFRRSESSGCGPLRLRDKPSRSSHLSNSPNSALRVRRSPYTSKRFLG